MKSLTPRRCITSCLIIALLTIVVLVGVDRYGRNSRVIGHIGSFQAPDIVRKLVDSPGEAYQSWKDAGYRGRTIVFISDRWESFDPGELIPAQMFRAYPLQLFNMARLLEDKSLNGVTFLYVATMNKICRSIVAILPASEIDRLKGAARKSRDYRVSDQGVFISRQGYPRWFTTGANFTGSREPVLLYVGASYFKDAEPEELQRQLSASGLETDCLILCNETGKDSVTPTEISKLNRFARLIGINS